MEITLREYNSPRKPIISRHTSAVNSTNACGKLDTRRIKQNSLKLVLT